MAQERPAPPDAHASELARETRSAAVVAAAILFSKLAGLLRQRVTAHFFGTAVVADVLAAAFRVGNLAQNLLGEGTLSASFIPVYAKLRAEGRDAEAVELARAALGLLAVAAIVVSALGVALAPWLSLAVAAGFDPAKLRMTTDLVRIVFPMTGMLVLCAWALGVLNAHRQFFLPYAAPVIWNAAQIAALLVAGSWLMMSGERLAQALAVGALAGALAELGALLHRARRVLGKLGPRFDHKNHWVRLAARRLPGVLLGRGVIQISGLIDTLLVSFLGTGANATFAYAQTLYLVPMSILGTGEAAVSLPEMARDTAVRDPAEQSIKLRRRLGHTLTRVAVLAIPAMVVLIACGNEVITVVLRTGQFDRESTARVAEVLMVYGFALLANAAVRLFATVFFALGDTRLPARYAVVRVVASTLLALGLMRRLGVAGVVLGATMAGWLEALLLGKALGKRLGGLGLGEIPLLRLIALGAATVTAPLALRALLPPLWAEGVVGSLAVLAAVGAAFVLAAPALGLLDVSAYLRRRRGA